MTVNAACEWFRATLLDFASQIEWLQLTLLLIMRRCMKSFSVYFIVANTVTHAHWQRVYHSFHDTPCDHRTISSCACSAVAVAAPAWPICRMLCWDA